MTPREADERLHDIIRRVRWWETEMWMRHAEHPVSEEYARNCVFCRGTGITHFCMNPHCDRKDGDDECLHPTAEEIRRYKSIQDEFEVLQNMARLEVERANGMSLPQLIERLQRRN